MKKVWKILLAAAILLLCVALLPTQAQAATSGACGDNLVWTLDDEGTLTISGNGAMASYDYRDNMAPWAENRASITSVIIEEGVTSIGSYAFDTCTSLTRITIPDSVTTIGEGAFYSCTGLVELTIPNSVTTLGDGAFYFCLNLASVNISSSVTDIGNMAFEGCVSLIGILVNNANPVYSSDEMGFLFNKEKTLLIQAPGGFSGAYTIPSSVTDIDNSAFKYCLNLTSVVIPDSVTTIGDRAFEACSSLTSVTIPDSIITISDGTFYCCTNLSSVEIPNSVTTIGDFAFRECNNLTSVSIPEGVTTIGDQAFYACSSLVDVTISKSVTTIGENAFYSCKSLTGIWVDEGNSAYCSDDKGVFFNKEKTSLIQAPSRLSGKYIIPDSVTTIGMYAFASCNGLTSVTIPDSVITIGDSSFYFCSSLSEIVLPKGVNTIKVNAFRGCNRLLTIYHKGSKADWDSMVIESGNEFLENATVIHNYSDCMHSYDVVETKPATCAEAGVKTFTCTACGDSFTEEIAKLTTHSYADGTCTVCGGSDPDYVPPVDNPEPSDPSTEPSEPSEPSEPVEPDAPANENFFMKIINAIIAFLMRLFGIK